MKWTTEKIFLMVIGVCVIFGILITGVVTMAQHTDDAQTQQACIKAGKSWTHNHNGWGECK